MAKIKLKKGDNVIVIAGSHKGHKGPIKGISSDKSRVFVEGITATKHFKPTQSEEGGIREIDASIHISNVMIADPKSKDSGSRVGYEFDGDKKVRIAKKSGSKLK
jgi:large subunit ribosomal protein L24